MLLLPVSLIVLDVSLSLETLLTRSSSFFPRLKTLNGHFPSTYTEAQCLCSGCILIKDPDSDPDKTPLPVESYDYNSVPIKQSKVFLKRELCSDGKKYYLKPVTLDVAVGCTCARVKTTSS